MQINQRIFWSVLVAIMLLSFGLRLWGVSHGLPEVQVADENSDLSTALRLTEGEIPLRHVRYHRSLMAYVDVGAVGGTFGYSLLTGKATSLSAFRNLYFADRALFTQGTRLIFALLTTLTIGILALAGRYISPWVGLLAAAVLAVNAFFALNSLYALPDALITFAIAVCLWMTMRLWKFRRRRDYFIAGFSVALVMLSKFSGVTIAIGLMIVYAVIVWENSQQKIGLFLKNLVFNRNLLWMVAGVIIGNLVLNPLPFFYIDDLIYELLRLNGYAYAGSLTLAQRIELIIQHILLIAPLAWRFMFLASLLGVLAAWRYRRSTLYWVTLASFAFLTVTIANVSTIFYKPFFWTPWLLPMALLSGIGLDALRQWLTTRKLGAVALIGTGILLSLDGIYSIQLVGLQIQSDTRQLAAQYVQTNLPPDTRIMTGDTLVYAVPLQRNADSIARARQLGSPELQSWNWWLNLPEGQRPGPAYNIYGPEMQASIDTYDDVKNLIADEHIEYIIETGYCTGTINQPDAGSVEQFPALNDDLRGSWELVATFNPFPGDTCIAPVDSRTGLVLDNAAALSQQERPGPLIQIFRVNP